MTPLYVVTFEDALDAHRQALAFGGRPGIVNENSIRSALGRPYQGYFDSFPEQAASLLHALVKNHGFADGNKRTALLVTDLFIRRSGYRLELDPAERIDDMVVAVASGDLSFDALVLWFTSRLTNVR